MKISYKKVLIVSLFYLITFNVSAQVLPGIPTLIQPSDNSFNAPLNVILTWSVASNAETYNVEISTDNIFNTIILAYSGISSTAIQVRPDLNVNVTYYWRVSATNFNGTGSWSNVCSFYTINEKVPLPPQLLGPYNRDVGLPANITFLWEYAEWANSYHLQIASDADFTTVVVDETYLSEESKKVYGLYTNTAYYWRVKAVNSSGYESRWSEFWQFYTGDNTYINPVVPDLTAPNQDETGLPTGLTFVWEYVKGADFYQLQVATDQNFNTVIYNDPTIGVNWKKLGINDLNSYTDYYWQVKAYNDYGGESIWSETRHFTTAYNYEYPAVPSPLLPYSSTTNLPTELTVVWQYAKSADDYHLQISTNVSFSENNIIIESGLIKDLRRKITGLEPGQYYYWRVSAADDYNGNYTESGWSDIYYFYTGNESAYPGTPSLSYPGNNTTGVSPVVMFKWDAAEAADTYDIEIATDGGLSNIYYKECGIPKTSKPVSLKSNTQYYWRITACNKNGSSQSSVWNFTTQKEAQYGQGAPLLYGPKNCDSGLPTDVTLFWLHEQGINSFDVEVSSDPDFSYTQYSNYNVTAQSVNTSGLYNNTVYYWRVRTDVGETPSEWSDVWCFITGRDDSQVPAAPKLVGPYDDDYNLPNNPTLFWEYARGTQSYQVQVADGSDFSNILFDESSLDKTWIKVSSLGTNFTYYWRVRAINSAGNGQWSAVWHFQIGSGYSLPDAPSLSDPYNSKDGVSVVHFQWNYARGADFYRLEIADNSGFNPVIGSIDSLPIHFMVSGGYNNNMTIYWRVIARNENGEGNWSDQWYFSTWDGYSYPNTPSLEQPNDYENVFSPNVILQWEESWGAGYYHLQVSTDNSFSYVDYDEDYIRDTKRAVGGLNTNTTYYWRVQAKVGDAFSSVWSYSRQLTIQDYPNEIYVSSSGYYNFPQDPEMRYYKLFGIPGNHGTDLSDILGSDDGGRKWQAYWDNGYDGSPSEYLEPYSYDNSNFTCVTGRAFWIIMNDYYLTIERNVQSAPIENGYAVIDLHNGWNMITNPFVFNVSWDYIRTFNDISSTDPIWEFNESFTQSSTMIPCRGYYYYNQDQLDQLHIPYQTGMASAKNPVNDNIQWEMSIALTVGDLQDISARLGVAGGAARGKDYFDYKKPRGIGKMPSVSFERAEWNETYPSYARDMRPPFDKMEKWDFNVSGFKSKQATLSFTGIADIPGSYQVYLIDQSRAKAVDLRSNSSYTFMAVEENSPFTVCVGNKEDVQQELARLLPREFALSQNYPNPFNPETMIPFSLPKQAVISLTIHNILGQTVRTLFKGKLEAGIHYMTFNGKDQSGNRLASGIYFCRMTSDQGHYFVRKMVLIK